MAAYQHLYIGFLKYISSQLSVISAKSGQLFTQRSLLYFQQQLEPREYVLLTTMLNSKLGHRREYFFLFIGAGLKVPKKPIPLLHFCLKELNDKKV